MFHILKTDTDMRDVGDAGAVDIGIDMSVNQSVDVVTQMRAAVKVGMGSARESHISGPRDAPMLFSSREANPPSLA